MAARISLNVFPFPPGLDDNSATLAYIDELEHSLEYIRESPDLTMDEKRRFFRSANTNLGESYSE